MNYTVIAYSAAFIVFAITMAILRQVIEGYLDRRGPAQADRIDSPYVAAEALLSAVELAFFSVLREALGNDYHLFAKVRLADIVNVQRGLSGQHYYRAFNRISAKHVDFVVCDPNTFRILGVIELDDRSHRSDNNQQRDEIKNKALAATAIPILRVPVRRAYSSAALREQARVAFC